MEIKNKEINILEFIKKQIFVCSFNLFDSQLSKMGYNLSIQEVSKLFKTYKRNYDNIVNDLINDFDNFINNLDEETKLILTKNYGLNGANIKLTSQVAEELNLSCKEVLAKSKVGIKKLKTIAYANFLEDFKVDNSDLNV